MEIVNFDIRFKRFDFPEPDRVQFGTKYDFYEWFAKSIGSASLKISINKETNAAEVCGFMSQIRTDEEWKNISNFLRIVLRGE